MSSRRGKRWLLACILLLGAAVALAVLVPGEVRSSERQARFFAALAREASWNVEAGASDSIRFPRGGPYDRRLGYALLPAFSERLLERDYRVEDQARFAPRLRWLAGLGLTPAFEEKTQAGLRLVSRDGSPLFEASFPRHAYRDFDDVPPLVTTTLLYIENRELLDAEHPKRNPAIEWDRLGGAALNYALRLVDPARDTAGGSTLVTQIEKFRHSPGGITGSPLEKLRQMFSASLRSYRQGEDTTEARRQIVVDFLNSVPLAAVPESGEVIGLAEALEAWCGADFEAVNQLLREPESEERGSSARKARARAYKQVLSLLLAQRRPTEYLRGNRAILDARIETYLRLLANDGVISPQLRDDALAETIELRARPLEQPAAEAWRRRIASPVRDRLVSLLGLPSLYELDRLDLTVEASLDRSIQESLTRRLFDLRDRRQAEAAGMVGFRLLGAADTDRVVYSFSLYERGDGINRLRVQTDNFEQALDINEQVKLDLGSTAKLRTLVNYLQIVASLHESFAGKPREDLRKVAVDPSDRLTQWAIEELSKKPGTTLRQLLEAALDRKYSASPAEGFFTGGGVHTFHNFKPEDDHRIMTVREAFQHSVNLPFIRLMRDIVRYYTFRVPGSTARILQDRSNPERKAYLERFADREGRIFLEGFYRKYQGQRPEEMLDALLKGVRLTPKRWATIYLSVEPNASFEHFRAAMTSRLEASALSSATLRGLYEAYSPARWDLADRGYIARVHPLELWLVGYLRHAPEASLAQILDASREERIGVYRWLFKTRRKGAQDRRIRTLLEIEAFHEIHREWRRAAYPFESLVPSYATAIGSSADRPAALSELMGILVNEGVRYPTVRIERLAFATGTPYHTRFVPEPGPGERVMPAEVAAIVKTALISVVEGGTAVRARGAFALANGSPVVVGGKTGTGDHRFKVYGAAGQLTGSRAVNRTATFVFFVGDRFFGVLTAYVAGSESAEYGFTSSLPTQLFKVLGPSFQPLLEQAVASAPPPEAVSAAPALDERRLGVAERGYSTRQ
jgi:membrane peptidoglycan carboxypeptidase